MRIDSNNLMSGMDTLEQTSRKRNVEKTTAVNSNSTAGSVESDAVSISEKGRDVSEMTKILKEMPDVRAERVAELKAQIADGTYNVSGRDIAEKIVNSALEDSF